MREEVEKALDEIRPQLQLEGGGIDLVEITDDVVKVRLKGACAGCPGAQMTLKMFVEAKVKQRVPAVKAVEAV